MTHYAWKRFLCPHDGNMDLSDNGFLTDPETDFFKYIRSDILSFEQISSKPCIVLLGEPGIGKSDVITSEYKNLMLPDDQKVIFNLGECGTGDDFKKLVFQSSVMQSWKNGNFILNLFLDGLDECRARVDHISQLMVSQLKELGKESLNC